MTKSETQIAEEYLDELKDMEGSSVIITGIIRTQMKEHKASCQRFLKFLKSQKVLTCIQMADYGACHEIPIWYLDKVQDLKQAITKYKENGI